MTTKKTTRQHYDKFAELCSAYGLVNANVSYGKTKEEWVKLFNEDEHLNNTPLSFFDRHYHAFRQAFKSGSLSENVCMIKHHLIFNVIGATPVFKD
jgi:hypothetical protein